MINTCINKATKFYEAIENLFNTDEIAQITIKLNQEAFINWYGEGKIDSFGQPKLIDDLYLENDKGKRITLNDLLNDKFYEERKNYIKDLGYLDKIKTFLEEEKIALLKRINKYKGTDYAKDKEIILNDLDKLDKNDFTSALLRHTEEILKNVESFKLRFYNYDKVNTAKLTKEQLEQREEKFANFILQAKTLLDTFVKVKELENSDNADENLKKVISSLKEIESKVTELEKRIKVEVDRLFRNSFEVLINNPEIKGGVVDFLAAQSDESKVQLLLDSLGDSHNSFLASIYKFSKKNDYEKDEEVKQKIKDWEAFTKSFNGGFQNFIDKVTNKETGRFIQEYKQEFEDTLFNYVEKLNTLKKAGKEKTSEYDKLLNEYFNFKKDNLEQPFVKEYYEALNLLTPKAREVKEELDIVKNKILNKKRKDLTSEDYEVLKEIQEKYNRIKSKNNSDGTLKTGDDLEIANSLFTYSNKLSKFYETKSILQEDYNKALKEAESKGIDTVNEFLKNNTTEQYTQQFWDWFKDATSKVPKSQELQDVDAEIKQLLLQYKNEKGEVKVQDLPVNILQNYNILENKKKEIKSNINKLVSLKTRRALAKEFKKYVVFEPTSEYLKVYDTKRKQLEDNKITKEEYDEWFNANHETNLYTQEIQPINIWLVMKPRDKRFIQNLPNNLWKTSDIKQEFLNPNHNINQGTGYSNPIESWKNSEYDNLSTKEKEDLKTIQDLLLYLVGHSNNTIIHKGYLPAIPKDIKSYVKAVKSKNTKDDKDYVIKNIEENDEIVKFIPFKYVQLLSKEVLPEITSDMDEQQIKEIEEERKRIREENKKFHGETINYNLEETMKAFIKTSLTNKYKNKIENTILIAREQLKNQKIKTRTDNNKKIIDKTKTLLTEGIGVEHEVSAIGSNIQEHFEEWLDGNFYDDFEKDEGTLTKVLKPLESATSFINLGFNPFSAINNKLVGNIQARIESFGGIMYDYADYRFARRQYSTNLTGIISNHKTKNSTNFLDAYLKEFDVLVSQDELSNSKEGALKTVLQKLEMVKNAAFFMQHIGEHQIQNSTLIAMSKSHRIIDGKILNFSEFSEDKKVKIQYNKKLTKEEQDLQYENIKNNEKLQKELKEKFEKYPTVLSSYELIDGYAKIKKDTKINKNEIFNFKERIIGINQGLHGIYNKEDAALIQRYALGRLAMQFRKWMRKGWNRRFGSKFGQTQYNEKIRSYEEGLYITTFKYLSNPFVTNWKEYKKSKQQDATSAFSAIAEGFKDILFSNKLRWNSLTDMERANIKKTGAEFGFLIGAIAIAFLAVKLKGEDDDEDENKFLTFTISQSNRLIGELGVFNFGIFSEGGRLITSPVASLGTLNKISKLGSSLVLYPIRDEEERKFKSGIYHGEDKALTYLLNATPGIKVLQTYKYMQETNQRYNFFSSSAVANSK